MYVRLLGAVGLLVALVFVALGVASVDDGKRPSEVVTTAGPAAPVLSLDGQFSLDAPLITVQSFASVTVPAERIDVALAIAGTLGFGSSNLDLTSREAVGPILTVLQLAGAGEPVIDRFASSPFSPATAGVMRFSWDRPDTFEALMESVLEAAVDSRVSVTGIEVRMALNDCSEPLTRARAAAFEAAEVEARDLARAAGLSIGEVVAISETPSALLNQAAQVGADECGTLRPAITFGTSNIDRPALGLVRVNVGLIVAFAIE